MPTRRFDSLDEVRRQMACPIYVPDEEWPQRAVGSWSGLQEHPIDTVRIDHRRPPKAFVSVETRRASAERREFPPRVSVESMAARWWHRRALVGDSTLSLGSSLTFTVSHWLQVLTVDAVPCEFTAFGNNELQLFARLHEDRLVTVLSEGVAADELALRTLRDDEGGYEPPGGVAS